MAGFEHDEEGHGLSKSGDRRPVVGVMGSGREAHEDLAAPLGRWLAEAGFHLLTGGGGGVMAAASAAFAAVPDRAGLVIGVLPGRIDCAGRHAPPDGYPNPHLELVIHTHLHQRGRAGAEPLSRNHLNVLSSDVIVALPGGAGTRSEIALGLQYGRPIVAYLGADGAIDGLPGGVPVARELEAVKRFVREATR